MEKTFYYIVSITNSAAIAKLQRLFGLAAEKLSKKCIQILHEIQVQRENISKKKYLLCGKHISKTSSGFTTTMLLPNTDRARHSLYSQGLDNKNISCERIFAAEEDVFIGQKRKW